jgi:hypothetical protein
MRQALARTIGPRGANVPKLQPGAQIEFIPAPTQGWDTETPIAELPQTRARSFDNWVPRGTTIAIRKGYSDHVTGVGHPVETLMPYSSGTAQKLFAAASSAIYDVSSPGAVGAAAVTSLTNARFSHVNFTTSGGSFLWVCNGADDPRHYNGTTWATPTLNMTTFADNDIKHVFAFKERLYFVFKDSLTFGYLPVQSIAGTVANFPLGAVFNFGGELIAGGTLSRDGGDGMDDFAVFLTSEGEIAVYQGFNPGSASEWELVGVYYIGEPVGDRPIIEIGNDLAVITRRGVMSVLRTMAGGADKDRDYFAQVSTPLRSALSTGAGFTGWEGLIVPGEGLLLVNAPMSTETAHQYIRDLGTSAPGRFTGWNFETFEIYNGECYAGTSDGRVVTCFDGNDDDDADITAAAAGAWTIAGYGGIKTLLEIRPVLTTATSAVMRIVGRADFRDSPPLGAWPQSTITNALIWGSGIWGTNLWGGEDATTRGWRAISGEGQNISLVYEARSNQSQMELNGFNLRYSRGGQI